MLSLPYFTVDAFASGPFTGNPAAVFLLDEEVDPGWMQAVAAEMNLSDTAFVLSTSGSHSLRWFTPSIEGDLCGHGTIAAAYVLWETGRCRWSNPIRFLTTAGELIVTHTDPLVSLRLPLRPPHEVEVPEQFRSHPELATNRAVWDGKDLIVELRSEEAVRAYRPDGRQIEQVEARAVILTAKSDTGGRDFVARFFAPRVGIPEDPVAGSAFCSLTPYWHRRLGKEVMVGFFVSKRTGEVTTRFASDHITVAGRAVIMAEGRFRYLAAPVRLCPVE